MAPSRLQFKVENWKNGKRTDELEGSRRSRSLGQHEDVLGGLLPTI
jgi:hypothetical protein